MINVLVFILVALMVLYFIVPFLELIGGILNFVKNHWYMFVILAWFFRS